MSPARRTLMAVAFFMAWIAILYAGADHPPPAGFFWLLIPLVLASSAVVYLRAPVYASWSSSHRPGRFRRLLAEGLVAGVVVSLIQLLFRPALGPSVESLRAADLFIWLAVLAVAGAANAALVYVFASARRGGKH
jgi:hypothetical protein